jgi:hypothetical protein
MPPITISTIVATAIGWIGGSRRSSGAAAAST